MACLQVDAIQAPSTAWDEWQKGGFLPVDMADQQKHVTTMPEPGCAPVSCSGAGADHLLAPGHDRRRRQATEGGQHASNSSTQFATDVETPAAGTCGLWDQPYDDLAAQETVRKLSLHWHRQGLSQRNVKRGAGSSSTARTAAFDEARSSQEMQHGHVPMPTLCSSISTCLHLACSAKVMLLRHLRH